MIIENLIVVLVTIAVAINIGILLKLRLYGLKGTWLFFAPFIPFLLFYVSTVIALEHKKEARFNVLFIFRFYLFTIKFFPVLVGITAKCLYLLMIKKVRFPQKLITGCYVPSTFQRFYDKHVFAA